MRRGKLAILIGLGLVGLAALVMIWPRTVMVLGTTGSCGNALGYAEQSAAQRATRVFCGGVLAQDVREASVLFWVGVLALIGGLIVRFVSGKQRRVEARARRIEERARRIEERAMESARRRSAKQRRGEAPSRRPTLPPDLS